MPTRPLLVASAAGGAAGVLVAMLTWTGTISWQHADSLVVVLLFGSLFAIGLAIMSSLRDVSHNMEMLRRRTKQTAENSTRTASRIEEVRQELMVGAFSHLPGQVGKLEGKLRQGETDVAAVRPAASPASPGTEFDAVFLINLDADARRFEYVSAMLESHGIAFERFPASDGNDPQFDDAWQAYISDGLELPRERHTGQRLIESRGAFGYLKTMQRLLIAARQRQLGRVLVLEDDVMLHNSFGAMFIQTWAELPNNWKLVYLGSAQVDRKKITPFSEHLYHPGTMANGSYAFAIDSSVYDQALASIERFDWPFDAGALREIDASYPSQVFAADPPLVIADVSQSAIRPGRELVAHSDKHGWNLEDYAKPFSAGI